MIIDLAKFIERGRPGWTELERILDRFDRDSVSSMNFREVQRFHFLYQKASADLSRIITFSAEPEIRRYLESLVARAYGEIHESRSKALPFSPVRRFLVSFPASFRRHAAAFWLTLAITLGGALFGALAVSYDRESREVLIPFAPLMQHPSERVDAEESRTEDAAQDSNATFAAALMTHNIRVSVFLFALGMTFGLGTCILLFYNGAILGAVAADYILAGELEFLVGWLLPHGSVEIPALLIAGQAGFVLAGALAGWGNRLTLRNRLRLIGDDLISLVFGLGVFLIWAGLIESFLSQHHEPVLPYALKIGFGLCELLILVLFLSRAGRSEVRKEHTP